MCLCLESRRVGCKGMEEAERVVVVVVVMVVGGDRGHVVYSAGF